MDPEAVLSVLPDNKGEAKSLKEIARAMGLEISTHTDWIRAERSPARVLRILIKWGGVARDKRQSAEGQKFWYNVYWKTELAEDSKPVATWPFYFLASPFRLLSVRWPPPLMGQMQHCTGYNTVPPALHLAGGGPSPSSCIATVTGKISANSPGAS